MKQKRMLLIALAALLQLTTVSAQTAQTRIGAIVADEQNVWCATPAGVLQTNRETKEQQWYALPEGSTTVNCMARHGDELWMCDRNSVLRLQGRMIDAIDKTQYGTAIAFDQQGRGWIGQVNGLQTVENGHLSAFLQVPGSEYLSGCIVRDVLPADPAGALWFAMCGYKGTGLGRYTADSGMQAVSLGGDYGNAYSLACDGQGSLYIATEQHGLLVSDGEKVTEAYDKDNSALASNWVTEVTYQEATKTLWAISDYGLYRLREGKLEQVEIGRKEATRLYAHEGTLFVGTADGTVLTLQDDALLVLTSADTNGIAAPGTTPRQADRNVYDLGGRRMQPQQRGIAVTMGGKHVAGKK